MRSVLGVAQLASQLQDEFALPQPVQVGAGVDTGLAVLGNLGSEAHADHTALGDAVNRAFRLEAATRVLRSDVALSVASYQRWRDVLPRLNFREERVQLKGFPEPTPVHPGSFARLRELLLANP
jgi:adenylate cyclase